MSASLPEARGGRSKMSPAALLCRTCSSATRVVLPRSPQKVILELNGRQDLMRLLSCLFYDACNQRGPPT